MSVSDAQYASFVDRVAACREAEDRAKEDTKRVYAEIAEAGEDKTEIGLIVRELRMSEKDRIKANLREEAAENGRIRYRRGKASHVRAREGGSEVTTQNTSVPAGFDPETGEEITTPEITHSDVVDAASTDVCDAEDLMAAQAPNAGRQVTHSEPQEPSVAALPAQMQAFAEAMSSGGNEGPATSPAGVECIVDRQPLPQPPADFKSDLPLDQLEARMRRTLAMKPKCERPWSCGSAGPKHCGRCANIEVAA